MRFDHQDLVRRQEVGKATTALSLGWRVGAITARGAGSLTTSPPDDVRGLEAKLQEALVRISGPVASGTASLDQAADIRRFAEITNEICYSEQERRHLRNWLAVRAQELLARPDARKVAAELERRLDDAGGEIDLAWPGRRSNSPTFAPVLNITTPAPVVNVTVEPPPSANKLIEFDRDFSGNIVSATTSDAEE